MQYIFLHKIPIKATQIKIIFSSLNNSINTLYIINKITVQRIAAKILDIITSFAITFKNIAVMIGSNGVVIILISLYGIKPSDIALAVL